MKFLLNDPDFSARIQAQIRQAPTNPSPEIPAPSLPDQKWYEGIDYSAMADAMAAMQQPTQMMEPYVHRGGGMVQGPIAPHVSGAGMNTAGLLGGKDGKDDKKDLMKGLLQMIGMGA